MKAFLRPSTPATGLCSTASALVALVAVAALMTTSAASPAAATEVRQSLNEGAAVRAAVAAVAAAARNLAQDNATLHTLPVEFLAALGADETPRFVKPCAGTQPLSPPQLAERLLDLPPPRA